SPGTACSPEPPSGSSRGSSATGCSASASTRASSCVAERAVGPIRRGTRDLGTVLSVTTEASSNLGPVGTAYASTRHRITDLVADPATGDAARTVPCCPAWSVHDVVAHLAGVVDDVLAGRLDGVATDPWTAAQVELRRGRPLAEVVDEWNALAPQFEQFLDSVGPPGAQAVADIVTHEHDIRQALGSPGARDSDALAIGLDFIAPGLRESARQRGIAPPGLRTPDGRAWLEPGH